MVNVRHSIAQAGYMLLAIWVVGWIVVVLLGVFFRNPDWSGWPIFLAGLIGYRLGFFCCGECCFGLLPVSCARADVI